MIKNRSIVCFSNDWENDPTSKHHVMKILSQGNKVLWINSIGMRRPTMSSSDFSRIIHKVKSWTKGAVKINSNLYHFTPIVLPFPESRLAGKINRFLLKYFILYYQKKMGMDDIQLWTFLPNITEIIGELNENLLVYYCVDEWSKFSFMDGELLRKKEIELIEKTDVVITTADHLYQDKIQFNSNTHILTHGVDQKFFAESLSEAIEIAPEISDIKGPVLGFFGLIHEWIDLDLLADVARIKPEWTIVLVGKASVSIDIFAGLENVILIGQQPYERLPSFCKGFDLGLIPFKVNELTINVNPIKMREYLAAGLPVVATSLPEVEKYQDTISIGSSVEEWTALIEKELAEDSVEKKRLRSEAMKKETWEQKVESLSVLIERAEQEKAATAM